MCSPEVMASVRKQLSGREGLTRRSFVAGAAMATAAAGMSVPALRAQTASPVASPVDAPGTISFSSVVDLTHLMTPETPVWPGNEPFSHEVVRTYVEHGFYAQALAFWEHTGTHLDAPVHFVEGADTADLLPVRDFVAPLVVIDITEHAADDPDAAVMLADVEAWEAANGPIPDGAFVAMNSGWQQFIGDAERFANMDADSVMHFPGFHPEATTFLVEQRAIVGVGTDTLSLDPGNSTDFGTHITVLGAGKFGIEGLAAMDQVPASGATVVLGAPKHWDASGGPTRVLALV